MEIKKYLIKKWDSNITVVIYLFLKIIKLFVVEHKCVRVLIRKYFNLN